jgi:hypothetical protein
MTTLGDIKTHVFHAIGSSDSVANTIVVNNINEAILAVTRLMEPPELISVESFVYPGGSRYISVDSSVLKMYDAYIGSYGSGTKLRRTTRELIDQVRSTLTNPAYAFENGMLYVSPVPTTQVNIYSSCLMAPPRLTTDSDQIPISTFDELIISLTLALTWPVFEEIDNTRIWEEITQNIAMMYVPRERVEQVIRGAKK